MLSVLSNLRSSTWRLDELGTKTLRTEQTSSEQPVLQAKETDALSLGGRPGHGLAKARQAQCLGPRAPCFLGILSWLPGDLTSRMGNAESKGRGSDGTSSRIFSSANVLTPGKTEDLISAAPLGQLRWQPPRACVSEDGL